MKRRSRLRRVVKWGGVALSLLVLLVWIVTLWRNLGFFYVKSLVRGMQFTEVGVGQAELWCSRYDLPKGPEPTRSFKFYLTPPNDSQYRHWLPHVVRHQGFCRVILPLWIPLWLVALPTIFLFWHDCRVPPGHCQTCGYDLTGNTSGVCPECGTKL